MLLTATLDQGVDGAGHGARAGVWRGCRFTLVLKSIPIKYMAAPASPRQPTRDYGRPGRGLSSCCAGAIFWSELRFRATGAGRRVARGSTRVSGCMTVFAAGVKYAALA